MKIIKSLVAFAVFAVFAVFAATAASAIAAPAVCNVDLKPGTTAIAVKYSQVINVCHPAGEKIVDLANGNAALICRCRTIDMLPFDYILGPAPGMQPAV